MTAGPFVRLRRVAGALLLSTSAAGFAQATPDAGGEVIIVTGTREILRIPTERSLGQDDIESYGMGTVGELLDEVIAETGETREDPVFLVNGERATGLAEIEDFPPEALERVDVLPVGSGAKVGASATRRVYNIVLKNAVDTIAARVADRFATEGGWSSQRGDVSYTRIRKAQRIHVSARARHEGRLLESERDIVQPAGSPAGLARARSLRPDVEDFELKASAADQLAPWLQGSISGGISTNDRQSFIGLVPLTDFRRQQERDALAGNLDLALNADVGSWLVSLLGTYNYERATTRTDRLDPGDPLAVARSRTVARTRTGNLDLTASGPLFALPAGALRGTVGAGIGRDSISSDTAFLGDSTPDHFVQWSRSFNAGIEVPLASRKAGFLPALGELTANAEFTVTRVSDFGSFTNRTFSLQWRPADWVRIFGSLTSGKTPPAVSSIADPLIETPGVRYYDPLRGETVEVTEISGGNPDLGTQRNANRRLSVSIKPSPTLALQVFADYSGLRNRDIITALPPASSLIFAAFPDRFGRDPDGTLRFVDVRPISLARQDEDRLRYGFNLVLPLQHGAKGRGGPRLQVNAAHSWVLDSKIVIAPGVDAVDLLSPDAIGFGGASRPRHQFDLTLGYSDRGMGVRLNAQYRGKSYLNLVNEGATDRLRFSPLTTFNLRAFMTGSRLGDAQWLKGTRLTLSVLNLTNDRQRVRDAAGETPLSYQSNYRDPLGRTVEIELRKVF